MNFLQRLIKQIVPPPPACGHESTITNLTARLQHALIELDNANARTRGAVSFLHELEKEIAATHPPGEEYVDALQSLRFQRERAEAALVRAQEEIEITSREVVVLRRRIDEQNREVLDLSGQLEETTSTIAVLQKRVRELGGEQLPLVDPPVAKDENPAGEEEEEVSNRIQELAYRLVGIFFDDDGPGRRHHWLMERTIGESVERVKVPIADAKFIERVAAREHTFVCGDTLVGDFHVVTFRRKTTGAMRVEYRSVDHVKRIVHPDEPLSLDLKPEPKPEEVAHV